MSERLNIKHLTPDPERKPEKSPIELSGAEREEIAQQREEYRQREDWNLFSSLAAPELLQGGHVPISPEQRAAMAQQREEHRQSGAWYFFSEISSLELLLARQEAGADTSDNQDVPPKPQSRNF